MFLNIFSSVNLGLSLRVVSAILNLQKHSTPYAVATRNISLDDVIIAPPACMDDITSL